MNDNKTFAITKQNFIEAEKCMLLKMHYLQKCLEELEMYSIDNWHIFLSQVMEEVDKGKISKNEGFEIIARAEIEIKQFKQNFAPWYEIIQMISRETSIDLDIIFSFTERITSNVYWSEII